MDKNLIQKRIEHCEKYAEKNYEAYQQCGEGRYYKAFERYDDDAEIFRLALNSADERNRLNYFTSMLSQSICRCRDIDFKTADEKAVIYEEAIKSIMAWFKE